MSGTNRRDFMRQPGAAAGASAAASLLPPGLREALAIPAAQDRGTIDVQHVVVLMQENCSFDHYFGAMRGVRGLGDPRPAGLPNGDTVWHQPEAGGGVLPFLLDTTNTGAQCLGDIDHWKRSQTQWKDHNAWVTTKGPMCIGHFTRADLPFYYALADEGAVASSATGATALHSTNFTMWNFE